MYSIVIMRATTQNNLFHALWLIYWCCTDTILVAAAEAIYISYRESLNTTYLVSAIETVLLSGDFSKARVKDVVEEFPVPFQVQCWSNFQKYIMYPY